MRRRFPILFLALGLLYGLGCLFWKQPVTRTAGVMPQEVYVWQRTWNDPVRQAVSATASNWSGLTVLAAEVSWVKGRPKCVRVEPDWSVLKAGGKGIGLALRIESYPGPFERNDEVAKKLADIAVSLVRQAQAQNVDVAELQLDFDCAESKLAGYRTWVEAIRERVQSAPLTITALPSWLDRPEFKPLVRATDGFVLQVHALERPAHAGENIKLCDPVRAQAWVESAARAGVPFKVALPTYSYVIAFDRQGRFAGASAEGPSPKWPAGFTTRELPANPLEMAALVSRWTTSRPELLQGVIWYRLPVSTDRWNWDSPTLTGVTRGQVPGAAWKVVTRTVEPGLVEVLLANEGASQATPQSSVRVTWSAGRLLAGDGLMGSQLLEPSPAVAEFKPDQTMRALSGGEMRMLGWLRFDSNVEVQGELVAK